MDIQTADAIIKDESERPGTHPLPTVVQALVARQREANDAHQAVAR